MQRNDPFNVTLYGCLNVKFNPGDFKNPKPTLVITMNGGTDDRPFPIPPQLVPLLKQCGIFVNDDKYKKKGSGKISDYRDSYNHRKYKVSGNIELAISGHRGVGEAINAILAFSEKNPVLYRDPGLKLPYSAVSAFSDSDISKKNDLVLAVKTIGDQISKKNLKKNKKPLGSAKQSSEYTPQGKENVEKSAHDVSKVTRNDKPHYYKPDNRAINETQSFISECFRLQLGSERVGKVRPTFDDNQMRTGTVSRELTDFKSLHEYTRGMSDDEKSQFAINTLIPLGLGELEVANHVFAENDAHWGNVGIGKDKNGKYILDRFDFDQALFPKTAKYLGYTEDSQQRKFKVTGDDINYLPAMQSTNPYNGLKRELGNNTAPLHKIRVDPKFINDKWSSYLKYLLINDNMYQARADHCISSTTRKQEMLDYVINRRNEFREQLLANPQFREYILKNPSVIKKIIADFEKENEKYKNKDEKKSLLINIAEIYDEYLKIRQEMKIRNFPESFDKLWNTNKSCLDNAISLLKDYADPEAGWFLTGHWNRTTSNVEQGKLNLRELERLKREKPDISNDELKKILLKMITEALKKPDIKQDGLYIKSLEFSVNHINRIHELQEENVVSRKNTTPNSQSYS